MAFVFRVLLLGFILIAYGKSVLSTTIVESNSDPLVIQLSDSGKLPFDEGADVQALETTLSAILGHLVTVDDNFRVVPGHLKNYSWDPKNNTYTLKLRDDLYFHNGRKATSQDLEYTLVRMLLSGKANWFKGFFSNIEGINKVKPGQPYKPNLVTGIKAEDEFTLTVKLRAANPSFLNSLSRSYFSLVPREELKSDHKTWKTYPVGVGQYKVTNVSTKNSALTLTNVNSDTTGPKTVIVHTDIKTKSDISLKALKSDYKKETLLKASRMTLILFNKNNELSKTKEFKNRIASAIHHEILVRGISSFSPLNQLLPSHFWGRTNKVIKYKKTKHNQLNLKVPVYGADYNHPKKSEYLKRLRNQLKEVNIRAEFILDSKKFHDSTDSRFPIRIISLGADVSDPLVLFNLFSDGSPLSPYIPSKDKKYKALLSKAEASINSTDREKSVKALSDYFLENTMALPLFEKHSEVYVKSDLPYNLGKQDGGLSFLIARMEKLND